MLRRYSVGAGCRSRRCIPCRTMLGAWSRRSDTIGRIHGRGCCGGWREKTCPDTPARDFVYSADEVEAMRHDISLARTLGLDGVVIGALCHDGSIDTDTCNALIEVAEGMSVTFHRAFDLLKSPFEALEQLIGMGVDRILTSGLAATALDGSEMLRGLQKAAGDKLIIMPGCGVKPGNAAEILRLSGCREIHASARGSIASEMTYRRTGVSMGTPGTDEYSRMTTDASEVRAIVEAIESLQIV